MHNAQGFTNGHGVIEKQGRLASPIGQLITLFECREVHFTSFTNGHLVFIYFAIEVSARDHWLCVYIGEGKGSAKEEGSNNNKTTLSEIYNSHQFTVGVYI